jgi:hypothetical protein
VASRLDYLLLTISMVLLISSKILKTSWEFALISTRAATSFELDF